MTKEAIISLACPKCKGIGHMSDACHTVDLYGKFGATKPTWCTLCDGRGQGEALSVALYMIPKLQANIERSIRLLKQDRRDLANCKRMIRRLEK